MENYKRINKPTARKMYNMGCSILLLPCKVSEAVLTTDNTFIKPVTISLLDSDSDINRFDRSVRDFEYYNCNSELGYYSHFYVSEEDYNEFNKSKIMCN